MSIELRREGSVGVILLNRPPANSYDYDFLRELGSAIDELRVDEEVRSAVLASASDRFFCGGADLGAFAAGSQRRRAMTALLGNEVFRKLEATPMVVVAALSGHALGGGLELAMACDLRFAARGDYKLGLTETNLGLFPGTGGTQRLPRLVGLSRGIDLIASGSTFGPELALDYGLVDRLFDDAASCLEEAKAYAARLAEGPAEAIGRAKVAAQMGYGAPLDLGLAIEREAIAHVFRTADAEEGITAFLEKRKPTYRGQ
ncbi:MAG: enoyl-CoA hydratase/isomerase family protein [Candidatus Dormibacteraeota bacterium]|nr:enoyl-CoA hydratase/isomerase family protein [Candidatus Dormibacteraeota bacterium]